MKSKGSSLVICTIVYNDDGNVVVVRGGGAGSGNGC